MSYELEARVGEQWSDEAVARLVGQTPTVNGGPGEVVAAWKDDDGHVYVRVRADGQLPDVFGVRGYSIGPNLP